MTVSGTIKLRAWGFLLAALGGFLIGLGPLLVWATQTLAGQLSHDVYGIDHTLGKVVLALGIVIVIGSFAMRFRATLRGMVVTAVIVIVAAIAALGITAYVAMDPTKVLFGVSKAQSTFLGDQLSFTLGVGIYLPMIGAVFVVVGTILSLRWAKRRAQEVDEAGMRLGESATDEERARGPILRETTTVEREKSTVEREVELPPEAQDKPTTDP